MEVGARRPDGDSLTRLFRKFVSFAALLLLVAAATWGVQAWRYRFVRNDADLLRLLPSRRGSTFFANVRTIRDAGFVSLLSGSRNALRDPEYDQFMRETGFDYSGDLDKLAVKTGTVPVLVAQGRFDWARIRRYSGLRNEAKKEKQITFEEIQPDVIRLKIGTVPIPTPTLARSSEVKTGTVPVSAPVWLRLDPEVLAHPEELPPVARVFAISLGQQASNLVFSLAPAASTSGSAFALSFQATFPNEATAGTVRNQLELQTKMLALGLARQHQSPDPASLTGLLTAGVFETAGKLVRGIWPVRNELLGALQ